jgi:hypothetical protein
MISSFGSVSPCQRCNTGARGRRYFSATQSQQNLCEPPAIVIITTNRPKLLGRQMTPRQTII